MSYTITLPVQKRNGLLLHSTIGKDDGNANLPRSGHLQRPQQRHRHEQEHEIGKDVTKSKNIFHGIVFRFAHRGRCDTQLVIEGSG